MAEKKIDVIFSNLFVMINKKKNSHFKQRFSEQTTKSSIQLQLSHQLTVRYVLFVLRRLANSLHAKGDRARKKALFRR